MFDTHPQYTVALVASVGRRRRGPLRRRRGGRLGREFDAQVAGQGLLLRRPPSGLARSPAPARAGGGRPARQVRQGTPFPLGGGRWRCFPVAELHETNDRRLWEGATEGWPLWKGESFDQYDLHGAEARLCPRNEAVMAKARKPRPGADSLLRTLPASTAAAVEREVGRGARRLPRRLPRNRLAHDPRLPRAAGDFLTNKAPYLAFVDDDRARGCLPRAHEQPAV